MNDLSIIKKIDNLGRIIIPKEIRRKLNISIEDDLKITLVKDNIIISKYSILSEIENKINTYGKIIHKLTNKNIIITDKDKIIFSNDNNYLNKEISDILKKYLYQRIEFDKKINLEIIKNINVDNNFYIKPIIINSDTLGIVILYSDNSITDKDKILINIIINIIEEYFNN